MFAAEFPPLIRSRSIRARMLLLIIAMMLPMSVLMIWYIHREMEDARKDAYAKVGLVVHGVAANLDLILREHAVLLKGVAREYQGDPPKPTDRFDLKQFVRLHELVLGMGVQDLSGQSAYAVATSFSSVQVKESSWGRLALQSDELVISDIQSGLPDCDWMVVLTYPVKDVTGARTGFAYMKLDLRALSQRVMLNVPSNIVIPVFDRNDRFLMRSAQATNYVGKPLPEKNAVIVRGKVDETFVGPDINGIPRLYSVATLSTSGWRVFAGVPVSEALTDGIAKRNAAIVVGVLTLAISLFFGWWRAGTIGDPVRQLAADVEAMMRDLTYRTAVRGPFEVEGVALGLNTLLDQIERQSREREALTLHYASMLRNAREVIFLIDSHGSVVDASTAACDTYGYTEEELHKLHVADLRAPISRDAIATDWAASTAKDGALFETLHQRKDGSVFPVEVKSGVVEMEGQAYRQSFVRDISERKAAEMALARRTRALEALSACNRALVTAQTETELLRSVCNVIVDKGGYRMVLVGFAEHDTGKTVRVAAHAGVYEGYLSQLTVSWADAPNGQGPTGRAIRNARTEVSRDFLEDPGLAPWREAAIERGYRSLSALPLIVDGGVMGALNVYSSDPDAFDGAELALLEELSHDLAYGIAAIRTTAIRESLEGSLVDSEERFRNLIEQSPVGIHVLKDGVFTYANPRMQEIMGFELGGLVGTRLQDFVAPDSWSSYERAMELLSVRGNTGNFSVSVKRHDGSMMQMGIQYVMGDFANQMSIIGMAQDISERERANAEIQRYVNTLEKTTEATLQAVSVMVEQRDPYTAGHERRVGELAAAIGKEMGLSEHQIKGLRLIGLVHDIGKIAVPAELLTKPTRLSEAEMALIRVHPQSGYDVLKDIEFPWPIAEVVLQHHERLDGSGYPRGLKDGAILLESRIMSVADVVESMSSHRPYRPSLGIGVALAEIDQYQGSRYDVDVVAACKRLFLEQGYAIPV